MELLIWINGKEHRLGEADPEMTLLQYLRGCGLKGTKLGCGEGGCGACTVVVSSSPFDFQAINACLAPLVSMHERHILTVEGLGTVSKAHLVQQEMESGSQCGFCTPGFVMSLYARWRNGGDEEGAMECFDGNLCRCTGYRPIMDAARQVCVMGKDCCKTATSMTDALTTVRADYDKAQEIIFPPKLKLHLERSQDEHLAVFRGPRVTWYRPTKLDELLELKSKYPDAKLVFGNTEVGIETKFKNQLYPIVVHVANIAEIDYITETANHLEIGAGVSLTRLKIFSRNASLLGPPYQGLAAIYEMLRWFAGTQIRNVSSWAGNVATASPISDLNPVWIALDATLILASREGERKMKIGDFFLGYRKTSLRSTEVIKSILVPLLGKNEYVQSYKQSKRRDDDISIVNAAFRVRFNEKNRVEDCDFLYGGMGPIILRSSETTKFCVGKDWDSPDFLLKVLSTLEHEFSLSSDAIGGMPDYRMALVGSFFFKFYLFVCKQIGIEIDERHETALDRRADHEITASQYCPELRTEEITGKAIAHLSGLKHSAGTAVYLDDLPMICGEYYAALVLSTVAHAKIKGLDMTRALETDGIVTIVTHKDIPGINKIGAVVADEDVMVEEEVTSCGQIIALVIGVNQLVAQRAAKLVEVQYEILSHILTIEEAIAADSFHSHQRTLTWGDYEKAIDSAPHLINGTSYIGGQEHFYLETHAALVVPQAEDNEYHIFASTQNPTEGQHFVSKILGIPVNRITCQVKRIGGGFGGKETRSSYLIAALAVAAHKTGRAVRCMLDREEDMMWSGQRHPFKLEYQLGMNGEGKILGADLKLYSNGGHSMDLSGGVLDRCITHIDNAYYFPALRVIGKICRTNLPSNTAFRGFGGPQGNFFVETMLTHASQVLDIDVSRLREINMYKDGDSTPFRMIMIDPSLQRMWDQLRAKIEVQERRGTIEEFNSGNRWKKKGIAMVPTKFGIGFGVHHLNQAGALIHVQTDGSVMVAHGGVEMGQGLHTKICQIVADAFEIPLKTVHLSETNTSTVANSSPSAASASSDLYGMAVLRACTEISERLEPVRIKMPNGTFAEIAKAAYLERIDLSAHGFYATPKIGYDWSRQEGRLYNYFTYGVSCSEVEIDVLTGDHSVLRTDIIMDIGRSLNPVIDIGQIEGAFVQGLGLFTIEQPLYLRSGMMLNRGPGSYKIPTIRDIPHEFNVTLLDHSHNEMAIKGSRAVGEPPLFMAASVFFAIHEAVLAARKDAIKEELIDPQPLMMDSPATAERIRLACGDIFVAKGGKVIDPRSNANSWCFEV